MPKKMSKLARKSVISKRIKDGEVVVLDTIDIESKKTSNFKSFLKDIKVSQKKILILVSSFQENLVLASRNIRNVFIENARSVSVYDLLDSEVILIDKVGVKILSEVLA
jgi:large subunit ribosomal protein L4